MKQAWLYRVVIKVNGLVHGRIKVASDTREKAHNVGRVWAEKRGFTEGFNVDIETHPTDEMVYLP